MSTETRNEKPKPAGREAEAPRIEAARDVIRIEREALGRVSERLGRSFSAAVWAILESPGTVVVLGVGKSGIVARKIAATFASTGTPAVFLHPALTDLALSLDLMPVLRFYVEYIERRFAAQAGFCTLNMPLLVRKLTAEGMPRPLVMTSINKIGYRMNPSRDAYEHCLESDEVDVVAMGCLASGFLDPVEAFDFIGQLPQIRSVVVGASSKEHIDETFAVIRRRFGWGN